MSRIEEALRRAGRSEQVALSDDPMPDALAAYPAPSVPDAKVEETVEFVTTTARPTTAEAEPSPQASGLLTARSSSGFTERLVINDHVTPVSVEQYRRVAAVLHHQQVERGIKVVMVASAHAGEGKTLTAANLALTLSESYRRRVLLIDADLRRPALDQVFQVQHESGLSDVLQSEEGSPVEPLQLSEWLSLLPGGKPESDPMAGLTSARMRQIVEEAAVNFDWVVLDTPPVVLLSDAHLLAAMAEAVVLVISAGRTPLAAVQRAIETFGRDRIVGVLLNRVEEGALMDAHYHHYHYEHYQRQRNRSGRRGLFGFWNGSETGIVGPLAGVVATTNGLSGQ
jgi:protein-tyrosine kinase